jgi:hypothetical protein
MKSDRVVEYGDFQTPLSLARRICALLSQQGMKPKAIVEPTCGIGNFVLPEFANPSIMGRFIGYIGINKNTLHCCFVANYFLSLLLFTAFSNDLLDVVYLKAVLPAQSAESFVGRQIGGQSEFL